MHYYRSVRWDEWWEEFCTKLKPDGSWFYPTSWAYACQKGKDKWERKQIWRVIGPKPAEFLGKGTKPSEEKSGRRRRGGRAGNKLPWLGDWQFRRQKLTLYEDEKLQALQNTINERTDALAAAQGVANVTLDWVARWNKWSESISKYFQGEIIAGTTLSKAEARARTFLQLQRRCFDGQMEALRYYLRCHGVGEDDVTVLAQMAMAGAQAALHGQQQGQRQALEHPVVHLLARSMVEKAKTFGLPLPEEFSEAEQKEMVLELNPPSNGKGKANGSGQ